MKDQKKFTTRWSKLKVHSKLAHDIKSRQICHRYTLFFFSLFCFLSSCLFVFFVLCLSFFKLKIYILIHIRLCGRVSDKTILTRSIARFNMRQILYLFFPMVFIKSFKIKFVEHILKFSKCNFNGKKINPSSLYTITHHITLWHRLHGCYCKKITVHRGRRYEVISGAYACTHFLMNYTALTTIQGKKNNLMKISGDILKINS